MSAATASLLNHLASEAFKGPGVGLTVAVAAVALSVGAFLLMTSFTRIVIVLSFVRTAIGTPASPPNMVIVALSIILTFFTMGPVFASINHVALMPYAQGHMGLVQAVVHAGVPMRKFLLSGTSQTNLGVLYHAMGRPFPHHPKNIPFTMLVVGFVLSQLTLGFQMAVMIYIPFLIIDLVTASVLMSLGMMMLPPTVVSLPIKLLLFVAVNGWGLIVGSLLTGGHP